jgi:hypothetical protein
MFLEDDGYLFFTLTWSRKAWYRNGTIAGEG